MDEAPKIASRKKLLGLPEMPTPGLWVVFVESARGRRDFALDGKRVFRVCAKNGDIEIADLQGDEGIELRHLRHGELAVACISSAQNNWELEDGSLLGAEPVVLGADTARLKSCSSEVVLIFQRDDRKASIKAALGAQDADEETRRNTARNKREKSLGKTPGSAAKPKLKRPKRVVRFSDLNYFFLA